MGLGSVADSAFNDIFAYLKPARQLEGKQVRVREGNGEIITLTLRTNTPSFYFDSEELADFHRAPHRSSTSYIVDHGSCLTLNTIPYSQYVPMSRDIV
ncbi:hypothetical protein OO184_19365 [Photorhabdus sp. APURE]|uniref:hypothetical protein n=1 Tax=Photorhabdus aballayi TaxID=2991723 RepID=UPI00223E35C1|nr:hypothetical protein [Photorhabdus aballayi]MCW7550030.1 hypothetical protein [Photorhabdus aballayi]